VAPGDLLNCSAAGEGVKALQGRKRGSAIFDKRLRVSKTPADWGKGFKNIVTKLS